MKGKIENGEDVLSAMGLTYWLKMREQETMKLKTVRPLARRWKGRISTV